PASPTAPVLSRQFSIVRSILLDLRFLQTTNGRRARATRSSRRPRAARAATVRNHSAAPEHRLAHGQDQSARAAARVRAKNQTPEFRKPESSHPQITQITQIRQKKREVGLIGVFDALSETPPSKS